MGEKVIFTDDDKILRFQTVKRSHKGIIFIKIFIIICDDTFFVLFIHLNNGNVFIISKKEFYTISPNELRYIFMGIRGAKVRRFKQ